MRFPRPQEIGLPEKFESWRPMQLDALGKLSRSTKRVKALDAPVGSGKTPLEVGWALYSKLPTAIVTESRGLQDQLLRDFKDCGIVDLRGRRNYDCQMRQDYTCEDGAAGRCPFRGSMTCPASYAEARAAASPLVVTNYDKWTSSRKFGMGLQHIQQVIFDEGHEAHHALARAMQVVLHHKEVEKDLGMDFLEGSDAEEMVNWKQWAITARQIAEDKMRAAREDLGLQPKPSLVRHYLHMKYLAKRLATLSNARPENWIVDETEGGYVFDPIRPGQYAEAALLLRIPNIIFLSGTLKPKALYLCGVPKEATDFWSFPSEFDPARCPIYYVPTQCVDQRHPDLSMLWVLLDQLAARRTDRKGLVGTVSYARRDEIMRRSRFANRMLINERGEAPTTIIEEFKQMGPGAILVSPSIGTGYDFPLKDCEWQFLCKIPYPQPSKILRAREAQDKEYAAYLAITKIEQFFGRSMRVHADQSEGFMGDDNLKWFMPAYGHLASRSFLARFRRVAVPPAPPRPL